MTKQTLKEGEVQITFLKSYEQIKVGDFLYVPNPINYLPKYAAEAKLAKINNVTKDSFSYIHKKKGSSNSFSGTISGNIPAELMILRRKGNKIIENLVGEELFNSLLDKHKRKKLKVDL